jgi:hypothetical protein
MRKSTAALLMVVLAYGTAFADDVGPEEVEERSAAWLPIFVSATTIAVAAVSVNVYARHAIDDAIPGIREELGTTGGSISDEDCNNQGYRDQSKSLDSACTWTTRSLIAVPTFLVMAPLAIVSGYLAFRSLPKKEKRSVALIPTVTTQSAGAMLDIRW